MASPLDHEALRESRLREIADGFLLARAVVPKSAADESDPEGSAADVAEQLAGALAASVAAADGDPDTPRRAAKELRRPLAPAHTRRLSPQARALLGAEVGGATGRRWIQAAPPRPGFRADPGVRACVRALATRGGS